MIPGERIDEVIGSIAVARDGELGTVGEVFVDHATGRPEWATVRTGPRGDRETPVPLETAELDGGRLLLPYDGETVRAAPRVDVRVEGDLSVEEEADLLRHYGLDATREIAVVVGTVRGPEPATPEPGDAVASGEITADTARPRLRRHEPRDT